LKKGSTILWKSKKIKKAKEKTNTFDCNTATYQRVTLYDFVYTHHCFPEGWKEFLALQKVEDDIGEISLILEEEAKRYQIEPPMSNLFKAFEVSSVVAPNVVRGRNGVKVVIMGKDPVPEKNQAAGLAFSLQPGKDPRDGVPSVFNMLVELKLEGMNVGLSNGDLTPWVSRGVLLLNAALTVARGTSGAQAGSHQNLWKEFTKLLVQHINKERPNTAWILLGTEAKAFAGYISKKNHLIKAGGHPSTQGPTASIRFFGRNYFHCANNFLVNKRRGGVDWSLPPRPGLIGKQPENCKADGL